MRGAHDTPIGGRFNSKAEALAWLNRKDPGRLPEGVIALEIKDPAEMHNALFKLLGE